MTEMEIGELVDRIVAGYRIESEAELLAIVEQTERETLYEACHVMTRRLCGNGFDCCSIINVKSGACSEDCKWCAQSAHFATECGTYGILPTEQVVAQAVHNEGMGIGRFSIVASGRRPSEQETERYAEQLKAIGKESGIQLCASLGLATEVSLQVLKEAGCSTYHCNMESAPSFFPSLCSTHTQAEKEATLRSAQKVGLRRCSGGIIGMGESRAQRAELALYLHRLGIESIPINILHPIAGTPLEGQAILSDEEVLLSIALFRLANPTAFLRFSGGRGQYSRETQKRALYIGVNAAITGDLLTTKASVTEQDMELFEEMGYDLSLNTTWDEE